MALNLDAVGARSEPIERRWSATDCLLYALGVGAGSPDPLAELEFTTENSLGVRQRVLPTFAVIPSGGTGLGDVLGDFDRSKMVHAEQAIELHREIAPEGVAITTSEVSGIYDKGKGALVVVDSDTVDEQGELLFRTQRALFIRGEGGFGGPRGPSGLGPWPTRDPDATLKLPTSASQALLYRLSGDRNPLHSDPAFAARAGFDRPILHGLCTLGVAGRALLRLVCDGDPAAVRSMRARFSRPVLPGTGLTTSVWRDGGSTRFRTTNDEGDVVLDEGLLHLV